VEQNQETGLTRDPNWKYGGWLWGSVWVRKRYLRGATSPPSSTSQWKQNPSRKGGGCSSKVLWKSRM